jgi:hypothetical protein
MKPNDLTRRLPGLLAALALSACTLPPQDSGTDASANTVTSQPQVPLPQYYGLYALNQGELLPIGNSSQLELQNWASEQDLAPETSFLVYSRNLAIDNEPLDSAIILEHVARVRDERAADGTMIPLPNSWAAPNLPGYQIPLQFEPVAGHPDMVIAAPEAPLAPGLYSLKLNGTDIWDSRFGIAWSSVAAQQYAMQYCVEKLPSGYQPCTTIGGNEGSEAFAIRDLRSLHTTDANGPALVIEGQLVNTSSVGEILPALSASLLDDQDQVVQALPAVTLPEQELEPGGVYDFRINVTNPAPDAARVRVAPNA